MREEIFETGWPEELLSELDKLVLSVESMTLNAWYHRPINLACLYALNPGAVERWVRLVSVLADLGSCLLVAATVMLLATSETSGRTGAVFGALAFGCNYLAARGGHFRVSDAVLTFFCALCLYFLRAGSTRAVFLPLAAAAAWRGLRCLGAAPSRSHVHRGGDRVPSALSTSAPSGTPSSWRSCRFPRPSPRQVLVSPASSATSNRSSRASSGTATATPTARACT